MPELAVTDDLACKRRLAAHLTTQLADDPGLPVVQVDALPHQRRALAVDATMAIGGQPTHASLQQMTLELIYIALHRGHAGYFRRGARASSNGWVSATLRAVPFRPHWTHWAGLDYEKPG